MNLKGLPTSRKDVKPVEMQEKWEIEETERCTLLPVLNAVRKRRFLLGQLETDLCTVASAFLKKERMHRF